MATYLMCRVACNEWKQIAGKIVWHEEKRRETQGAPYGNTKQMLEMKGKAWGRKQGVRQRQTRRNHNEP